MSSTLPTEEAHFERFLTKLTEAGLRPALAYLLGLTTFRFIAIFRFHEGRANAAAFYDRDNPSLLGVEEVPSSATYCCFARDSKGAFITASALEDPRLEHHVARETVQSYCGIPIMTPEGTILGTLCMYDTVPRDSSQVDLALMVAAASALQQRDLVPPYPGQPV